MSRATRVARATGRLSRQDIPCSLPGATRWSDKEGAVDAVWLVHALRGMPQILRPLEEAAAAPARRWGPVRMTGSWVLAYVAFVVSRFADIQPWVFANAGNRELWVACGFERAPAYRTVWQRFIDLEPLADDFEAAASLLIQRLRAIDTHRCVGSHRRHRGRDQCCAHPRLPAGRRMPN